MRRIALWNVGLATLLAGQPAVIGAQEAAPTAATGQLVLYDDFGGGRIDPTRWTGMSGDFSDMREMVREIVTPPWSRDRPPGEVVTPPSSHERALRMSMRTYGPGWGLGGPWGLLFANYGSLTEIATTVTVRAAQATGCTASGGVAAAGAEFRGQFFNTEPAVTPGSNIGDVQVAISIARYSTDATRAIEVDGFYTRCEDQYCGVQTTLGWGRLGYVYPGQPARLRVKWDRPNHQFIFQLNGQPPFISPYTVSDTTPAEYAAKWIGLVRALPACTPLQPTAMIDAYFSDVFVNAQ